MTTAKPIRYLFIFVVYNLIMALIAYGALYISDYYEFEYKNWTFVEWWVFISILVVIAVMGLYLAPFYDELLDSILERILINIKVNKKVNRDKIKDKIRELEKLYKDLEEED